MTAPTTIWLIDDNDEYREVVCAGLQMDHKLVLSGFRSVEDALRELTRRCFVPRVILLDVGLEGMSGIESIPLFKRHAPEARIIMLTIDGREQTIVTALRRGASGYVQKCEGLKAVTESIICTGRQRKYLDSLSLTTVMSHVAGQESPVGKYHLSLRETEILEMIVGGLTRKEIADRLRLGEGTVISHYENIYRKLNVHKLSDAVSTALRESLVRPS